MYNNVRIFNMFMFNQGRRKMKLSCHIFALHHLTNNFNQIYVYLSKVHRNSMIKISENVLKYQTLDDWGFGNRYGSIDLKPVCEEEFFHSLQFHIKLSKYCMTENNAMKETWFSRLVLNIILGLLIPPQGSIPNKS